MRRQYFFISAIFLLMLAVMIPPAQAQTFKVLHQFNGDLSGNGLADGANPEGGLTRDAAGNLFGTTFAGGIGKGVVFKIDTTGKETVLFTFQGVNGSNPATPLLLDETGNLVGVADGGPGAGMVFRLDQQGEETQLFDFVGGLFTGKPGVPTGGIVRDKNANVFGTTFFGGKGACQFSCGSIYRLDSLGRLHVMHNFSGGADGSRPYGPLVRDASGNLYGVAQEGGNVACPGFPTERFPDGGCGIVFKISRKRVLTVLHTFAGGADGAIPQAGLLMDATGNLFGSTFLGGNSDHGVVFKIASDGNYTVLHRFTGADGSRPNGNLVSDSAGNLYGTAQEGGLESDGTAWKLSVAGQLKVLHHFTGLEDGSFPLSGLIRDAAGNLYGTTVSNGLIQRVQGGNVFKITP